MAYGQGLIGSRERLKVQEYLERIQAVIRVDAFPDFAKRVGATQQPPAVRAIPFPRAGIATVRRWAQQSATAPNKTPIQEARP